MAAAASSRPTSRTGHYRWGYCLGVAIDLTPNVLRNKGCPVDLRTGPEPDAPVEQRWVRFTANTFAELELAYSSLERWQEQLARTPFLTIRRTLAIVFDTDERTIGGLLVDGQINGYAAAVSVAAAIANGVDPTLAAEMLRQGVEAAQKLSAMKEQAVRDEMAADREAIQAIEAQLHADRDATAGRSPGTSGSEPGLAGAAPSTSSGPAAPPKSFSSSTTPEEEEEGEGDEVAVAAV